MEMMKSSKIWRIRYKCFTQNYVYDLQPPEFVKSFCTASSGVVKRYVIEYRVVGLYSDRLARCRVPVSNGCPTANLTITRKKWLFRQAHRSRGGFENVSLVLINIHCRAGTRYLFHTLQILLQKSGVFVPEYFLPVHVMCGNLFCTLCLPSQPTNKNHTAWDLGYELAMKFHSVISLSQNTSLMRPWS
jgi:hypothetical protein